MSITNKNIHDNFRFVGAFASEAAIAAAYDIGGQCPENQW